MELRHLSSNLPESIKLECLKLDVCLYPFCDAFQLTLFVCM